MIEWVFTTAQVAFFGSVKGMELEILGSEAVVDQDNHKGTINEIYGFD